ncbi:hypothetical protein A3B84_00665 [Candidatus Nomurabacteria bacterium RIFCSPHIGHO2_02_FULL_35_13]|uniref:Zinc-binding domain-containing protein n=1 Tax=Candidatus Nomurabacteria bacterium RIFCSPHIGHO2_02_FULL_35_13 TaxID=1801748 RepID=A0A1F6VNX0_9BACT|nr:MAG: hypothetical protein A3B84_00665 [Candidatus Nomurabacteria bacterium RIFCSPHIGHO2_02_FULL_35_13]
MKAETKSCQNCKKGFTIESEDFNFYEKIKVPPPTWCPECRMVRRLSFINVWSIYWRSCDKCGNKTISLYPPEQKITSYCSECWWSDSWDGTEYAMDYDPLRPFLEQVKELSNKTPYMALESLYTSIKNSNYSNGIAWCKDCYLVFWADYCDNVFYSSLLNGLKYSADCIRGYNSELCYESIGFTKNYMTFFSDECDNCVNVWFSRNCYGCTDCVGCVNLRGATNFIFNVKYSKEEYEKELKKLGLDSWTKLREFEKEAHDFWLAKPYREYNGHSLNFNVTGEHVYTSKNSKEMYIVNGAENCKWCQFITVPPAKDCWDYSGWGNNASMVYECFGVGENVNNIKFSYECFPDSLNLEYCSWCIAGKNNFGCFNLKRKKYCILNKEYSKEEYEKLRDKIIKDMKTNPYVDKLGRKYFYGEFFPPEMSKFPYNKSNAMKFLPKTKEEALAEGYNWSDMEDTVYNVSKSADSLPERIIDTKDDILNEIIKCGNCGNGYKITQGELNLLRKMNLPIPRECPKCRENKRFARMTKPKLYNRTCMKCNANIYTPYSSEDPKTVYCVKCYQGEFL